MNESTFDNSINANQSQQLGREIEVELPGSTLSLGEAVLSILRGFFNGATPPEFWAERLEKALDALPRIADALEAQPHNTDILQQIADGIEGVVEGLDHILEALEATTEGYRPPSPPMPVGRGGRKSRTTETDESPGIKRLRQFEKGGGES